MAILPNDPPMPEDLAQIREALGLPEEASMELVVETLRHLKSASQVGSMRANQVFKGVAQRMPPQNVEGHEERLRSGFSRARGALDVLLGDLPEPNPQELEPTHPPVLTPDEWHALVGRARGWRLGDHAKELGISVDALRQRQVRAMELLGYHSGDQLPHGADQYFDTEFGEHRCPGNGFASYVVQVATVANRMAPEEDLCKLHDHCLMPWDRAGGRSSHQ